MSRLQRTRTQFVHLVLCYGVTFSEAKEISCNKAVARKKCRVGGELAYCAPVHYSFARSHLFALYCHGCSKFDLWEGER